MSIQAGIESENLISADGEHQKFKCWVNEKIPHNAYRKATSASNGPFVMTNGFRFGLFNIEGVDFSEIHKQEHALVLYTQVVLPPHNVLNLGLVFQGDALLAAEVRRDECIIVGDASKVRVYLHKEGVFFRAKGDPAVIEPGEQEMGEVLKPSAMLFANVRSEYRLDAVEVTYINYLDELLGDVPVVRIGESKQTGGVALDPQNVDVNHVKQQIANLGGYYNDKLIERYHVALNHLPQKHFVLLTGISGTGKTMLAKAYAFAMLGEQDFDKPSADYFLVPIRPGWNDPAHLIGYLDAITGKYQQTTFLRAVLRAQENAHRPVFVCLDEMNLAQPEHYFSDFMSAMESGVAIRLHEGNPEEAGVPNEVPYPKNLYVTGTVNVDETTHRFSPRLLDRANVIDMSDTVDILGFINKLIQQNKPLSSILDKHVVRLLMDLQNTLTPHGLHFGYRVVEEISAFLLYSQQQEVLDDALDIQIKQKVLTKLRGGHAQAKMLDELRELLKSQPTSKDAVDRMKVELTSYDSFQFWS